MALTNDQITAQNFKDFYGQIRPYLNGAAHSGFTPVGTVISVMGNHAPMNYLVCDGTAYNISDYPELATYFTQEFGSNNYFGGNGTTTFAVPDLRGEFLRGSGSNSHTNQGDGSSVGMHQDATELPQYYSGKRGSDNKYYLGFRVPSDVTSSEYNIIEKADKNISRSANAIYGNTPSDTTGTASTNTYKATTRPTNTSVLYCIASKNIFMDAGNNYSTEEQVVGTWIDGKPLYQKTVVNTAGWSGATVVDVGLVSANIDTGFIVSGFFINTYTNFGPSGTIFMLNATGRNVDKTTYDTYCYINPSNGHVALLTGTDTKGTKVVATVQYTKTTD